MWSPHSIRAGDGLTRLNCLSTLTGLSGVIHETWVAAEPRALLVVAGLLLVGIPVDDVLRRWLLGSAPQPPTSTEPPATRSPARSS